MINGLKTFAPITYSIEGELKDTALKMLPYVRAHEGTSGHCMEYASLGASMLPGAEAVMGSLMIVSATNMSSYGHAYFPDTGEFHAWIEYQDKIIDFALPEMIQLGSTEKDDVGYFLEGRKPIILAGTPPEWLGYIKEETVANFLYKRSIHDTI